MKSISLILVLLFFGIEANSQSLDSNITSIANDIAQKVSKKNKVRLALTDFVNNEGKVDGLTEYIRNELELQLINADNLQVIDRKHIKLLLSENKLQSDGLIDESTAKSAVSFVKVDGWVIAEITSLDDQIKIKITVTDVSTSLIFAASASTLINDVAIKNLREPKCTLCGGTGFVNLQAICNSCNGKGNISCKQCGGSGTVENNTWAGHYVTCSSCKGTGKFKCGICTGTGKIISTQTCSKCKGTGKIN